MRLRVLASLLFSCAVTTAAACASVPEVTFSDDAGGGGSTCTGAEVCDDGIDNDCNGATDCADAKCQAGWACTEAAPAGWELVAFSSNTRPGCPSGFGATTDLEVVMGTGAGTCSCACTPTGSTCGAGQYTVTSSDQSACAGGSTASVNANANAAACTALGTPLAVPNPNAYLRATPPAGPSACTGTTSTAGLPALTSGRTCAAPPRFGKGCPGAQVCAPRPAPLSICAVKTGANTCPATFPTRLTAGTGAREGRSCNSCTCSATPCTGTVTLFEDPACSTTGKKSAAADANCAAAGARNFTAQAYKSTMTSDGCTQNGFDPASTGAIGWTGQETVCCK